jgi:N-acetylglutamate synthase-like GNAT family acetyltransferase
MDDLPQLTDLWRAAQLPVDELEKQFTDFQVAEDEQGNLAGAIAMHISGSDGWIYSETFADFGLADTLRPQFWTRLQVVAHNHGLFRLWTEESAPWWKKDAGFATPTEEIMKKLPEVFGPPHAGWLAFRLKDEAADPERLEKEIAMFREAERIKREKIVWRGKVIRTIATVISALLFLFAMGVLFWVIHHRRR